MCKRMFSGGHCVCAAVDQCDALDVYLVRLKTFIKILQINFARFAPHHFELLIRFD